MSIGLLGPLEIDGGAQLEPRDRIALSVLAVRHGRAVSPDELADVLWRGAPPATWHKQVQICVARLRWALGASAIETLPRGYRLALDGDGLDIVRFERLAERGRAFAATGDATRAASAYARALALWRGHPLEELDGWPSGRSEAARLEELRRTIEEDLLEARLDVGEHRRVAVEAEALVAEQPWRERRWAILALARYRCRRQADALESIRIARRTLAEQLGLEASSDLARSSCRSCARTRRSPRRRRRRAPARRARTRACCRTSRATRRVSSAGTPMSPPVSTGCGRARCSSWRDRPGLGSRRCSGRGSCRHSSSATGSRRY